MLLFVLFSSLLSASLAGEPAGTAPAAVPSEPQVIQTVVAQTSSAQVFEAGGQRYVSYQGSRSANYDAIPVIKFVDGDLLFRGQRGSKTYFTLAVLEVPTSQLFVMAEEPSSNVYLDWRQQLYDCYPLMGVVALADGTTHYVAFHVNRPTITTFERIGPRVQFGQTLPSHVCWVGPSGLVLLLIEPRQNSIQVDVWYSL